MKFLIADGHTLAREGMAQLLLSLENVHTIFQRDTFPRTRDCIRKHPDLNLILLDLSMPTDGLRRELQQIRLLAPSRPLVVISASDDTIAIDHAISVGIQGCLLKTSSRATIKNAVDKILAGGRYFPAEIRARMQTLPATRHGGLPTESPPPLLDLLTDRQRDVLRLMANGMCNKEIARTLDITEPTVRSHAASIFRILGVRNRTHASRVAIDHGIL